LIKIQDRKLARKRRHRRVRKQVSGTGERPRLSVFRSSKHIYAQVIDDLSGRTLAHASTLDPEVRELPGSSSSVAAAEVVGRLVGSRALNQGVTSVVFDRGGYIFHGRVAAVARGARTAGLDF
jgi:large subunit ribosomal protein L18